MAKARGLGTKTGLECLKLKDIFALIASAYTTILFFV
mgnify:CR=1 FL=1